MAITAVATVMLMAAYFLVLYAAVGFIQDKRLFSSAPKEIFAVIRSKKERFPGAHIIGWVMMAFSALFFIVAFALGVWDGVKKSYDFVKFFERFLIMLYCVDFYDIILFDWFLLCHSGFYPHFYPETKNIVGAHLFGFNKKTHALHFLIYIPVCAAVAFACTLF